MSFKRGAEAAKTVSTAVTLDGLLMTDQEKEALCRSLLSEFGVTHVRGYRAELVHGCVLPFKAHQNQDREPTASLNYEKLTYNCLGCGNGGSLLWFIGVMRGISSTEARSWLANETGNGADEQPLVSLLQFFDQVYDKKADRPPPLPNFDPSVLDRWMLVHPWLTDPIPEGGRGVPLDNVVRFKVGYDPEYPVGPPEQRILSPRIIFPHFWRGQLVGWQTRRLTADGTGKYKNSTDFPKDETLYNYDLDAEMVVVVESPMSVVSKGHVVHMEATFGADVTDTQCRLLADHRGRVVLWFDNDESGWKGTERLGEYLSAYGPVWVVDSDYDDDPASMTDGQVRALLQDRVIPYPLWSPPQIAVPVHAALDHA